MTDGKAIKTILGVAVVGLATAQIASCSGDQFTGCENTYTCAPGTAGAAGGPDGSAGSSGSRAGTGGRAGSGGEAGSGDGDGGPTTGLGAPCTGAGTLSCQGAAQKLTLICQQGTWQVNQTCNATQNCDQASGACAEIKPECVDRMPGDTFCQSDAVVQCGADLVTSTSTPCAGRCLESSGSAACQDPSCGDGKVEGSEECDDGNTTVADGCSATCHWEVKQLAAGGGHTCALAENGAVKCWGFNSGGELGLGDIANRGDDANEMGAALPAIDLGPGRKATFIAAGPIESCAVLDNGGVKCWGFNAAGQLGQGDTAARGDQPNEVAPLAAIDLGTGRSATWVTTWVTLGAGTTCALLDNGSLKCWGDSSYGELGIGAAGNRGDQPGEMGDALPVVNFCGGLGDTVEAISVGQQHACAIPNNHSVRCWGDNAYGELGEGDTTPQTMPYSSVNLGAGRTATAISLSEYHFGQGDMFGSGPFSCALLDNGTVKCWGWVTNLNLFATTGSALTQVGDTYANMGDALPPLPTANQHAVKSVVAGGNHLCLLLDDGTVQCFGRNESGQVGHAALTKTQTPPILSMGTGRTALQLAAGGNHTCALLDDRSVKCWGDNTLGQLGQGDKQSRGLTAADFGDNLPTVELGF